MPRQKKVQRPLGKPPEGFGGKRAYGEWRKARGLDGGNHVAVIKAIESGRIHEPDTRTGWIDFRRADLEWEKHTKSQYRGADRQPPSAASTAAAPARPGPALGADPLEGFDEIAEGVAEALGGGRIPGRKDSEAMRMWYQAQRERLEFKRESGKLLDAENVRLEQFRIMRAIRDGILSIVPRLREQLAAAAHPDIVEAILREEILRTLDQPGLVAQPEAQAA